MNRYPWLDQCLQSKAGAQKNYQAVWGWHRYLVGGKMFAATCQPGPEYRDYGGREMVILKADPSEGELLRAAFPDIVPGFYSDKRHWNSIFLDGNVPEEVLRELCEKSYRLVLQKLTKKMQREIAELPQD